MNESTPISAKRSYHFKIICLCLIVLAFGGTGLRYYLKLYPDRGAQLHFSSKSREFSWTFGKRIDALSKSLQKDSRLICVDKLPTDLRAYYSKDGRSSHPWPILGADGTEFSGLSVWPEETSRGIGLRVNFRSKDMYSKKIRHIRTLISSAIGEKDMGDIIVWIDEVEILPRLGDGSS